MVLCSKLGEDQKRKKDLCDQLLFKSMAEVDTFSLPVAMGGGAIFASSAKVGLKSAQIWHLAYSACIWGGGGLQPPLAMLQTATLPLIIL